MAYDRQWVVSFLHRMGYPRAADEAAEALPDPVTKEQVQAFADQHGISRDELISEMGGSP